MKKLVSLLAASAFVLGLSLSAQAAPVVSPMTNPFLDPSAIGTITFDEAPYTAYGDPITNEYATWGVVFIPKPSDIPPSAAPDGKVYTASGAGSWSGFGYAPNQFLGSDGPDIGFVVALDNGTYGSPAPWGTDYLGFDMKRFGTKTTTFASLSVMGLDLTQMVWDPDMGAMMPKTVLSTSVTVTGGGLAAWVNTEFIMGDAATTDFNEDGLADWTEPFNMLLMFSTDTTSKVGLNNLKFSAAVPAVPVPSTLLLLGSGLLPLLRRIKRS